MRSACWLRAWTVVLVALLIVSADSAGQGGGVFRGRQRRIKWFDFEERPRNPYELPEHWFAIGREAKTSNANFYRFPLHMELTGPRTGFPPYTRVAFDARHSTSGGDSLMLGLDGGSAGAFLEVGVLGAVENSDYLVTARLRTTDLNRARARLVAYFIDHHGNRIEASESATALTVTNGAWQTVSVKLFGDYPKVAWIGLQLELLQPRFDPRHPLGRHQVVLEEMKGGAWFDDIAIWQLPRLVVRTQSDVNIVRAPQRPELSVQVLDLTGRPVVADLVLHDERLNVVARMRRVVGAGSPPKWKWRPRLTSFGWYLVDLRVREQRSQADGAGHGEPVGRSITSLLWLPEESMIYPLDAVRFGISAEGLADDHLRLVPELMDEARLDSLVMSAWGRDTTLATVGSRQELLDEVLQRLLRRRRRITMSLNPVPDELAGVLDIPGNRPMGMFARPLDVWWPYLAPTLMRHGQRVRWWQVGSANEPEAFFHPDLGDLVRGIEEHLRNMTPEPRVVLPWGVRQSRRRDAGTGPVFAIHVPQSVPAERLGDYLAEWASDPPADVALNLELPPATRVTHARRIDDLVLRMLYAWEAGAGSLQIDRPWTVLTDRHLMLLPDPVLGVFSVVSHRLAGRRVVGRLPLGHGLECMIFDGPAGGMLAAWNALAEPERARIDLYLGEDPVAIDVWGNRSNVPATAGRHTFGLGPTPVFLEGTDSQLALFRAGFRIDPAFIESKQIIHRRTLTIGNPWRRTISGRMTILAPESWNIQPHLTHFSIASGETRSVPITLRFPRSELAGRKTLVARFDFMAEREYVVDLSTEMELGLLDVKFDANLSRIKDPESGRSDVLVTVLITNTGDRILSLRPFAIMQGHPRQMLPIQGLRPGQSVVRRFRFEGAGTDLATKIVRTGLRELNGPAVLNVLLFGEDER